MPERRAARGVDAVRRRRRVRSDRERQERRREREEDATMTHRSRAVQSREPRRRSPVAVCRALPPKRTILKRRRVGESTTDEP